MNFIEEREKEREIIQDSNGHRAVLVTSVVGIE